MTALDLINKFNKDVWNHSDRMFGDALILSLIVGQKLNRFHFTM